MNEHRWEQKAKLIYEGTQWEKAALSAGKAMDNRLNTIAGDLFGQMAESGSFDMPQWLAWFDCEVLARRGLISKAPFL
jgi:hypothetical protein